ncbi:hypothetical protein N0V85_009448, partial [Neurospora sp. IMI 360204]
MLLPFGLTTGLTRSLGLVVALVASTHAVYIPHGPSLPPYSLVHGDVTTASTSTTSLVADASTTNTAPSSIRLSLTRYSTSTRTVHVVETVTPAAASASSNSVESGSADVAFTSTDVVTDVATFTPAVVSTPTGVVSSSTDAVSASSGVVSSSGSVVSSSTDGASTSIEVGTLTVFPEVTSTSTSTTTRRTTITSVVTATPSVADRNAFLSTANAIDHTPLVIMPYDDTWHTAFVTSRRRGKRNAAVSSVSSTATDASTSTSSPLSTSTTTITSTLHILVTSVVQVAPAAFIPTNPKIVTAPMVSHPTALALTDASTSTSSPLSTSTTTITSTSTTTSYTTVTATAVIVPEPTLSTLDEAKEGCLVCQDIFDDNGEVPPETLPNNSRRRVKRSLDSLEEDGKVPVGRKLIPSVDSDLEGESADANVTADVTAVDGQEDGDAPSVVTRQLVPPDLFNITVTNHTKHTDRTSFKHKPIRLSPINNITIPTEVESGEAATVDTDGRDDAIVTRQLVPPGLNKLNITDNPPPFLPTNINFTNYNNDATTYTTRTGKPIRLSPINNITLTTRTVLRLKPHRLPPINNITIPNGTLPNHTNHTLITRRTSFK